MRRNKTERWREVLSSVLALGVVALAYTLTSCTQEPPLPYDGEQKEYMDFSLELTSPGAFMSANTRSIMSDVQQNAVNRAEVLIFKDNILLYHEMGVVTDVDGTSGIKKRVEVFLKTSQSETDLYDIMVIGNPPTDFNFASYVDKTKDELKSDFNVAVSGKWAGSEFIMYGEALQRLIMPTTTNNFKIELLRSLARVDIGVGAYNEVSGTWSGLPNVFTLKEVRVVNSRDKFAVIPAATIFSESGNVKVSEPTLPAGTGVQGTTAADAITYSGAPDITDNCTQSAIFLAEAPNDANRVTLLVGGSYKGGATTYYRIDMCVPRAGVPGSYDYLPILRNHLYRISITGVSGEGFADPQEALVSAPINITTELTPIVEGGTGDIVFDGNNYIQTDASDVLLYSSYHQIMYYTIATVKANFAAGVAATVTGPGITAPMNLSNGVATPIKVVIPEGVTTGNYTIKVGRLTKVISLTIQPAVDAHFDILPFMNVASIRIENPQPWLTLSQSTTYVKSEQQSSYILGNSAGKACFHFDENLSFSDGVPRIASALVLRNNNSGITRAIFEQYHPAQLGYFGGAKDNYGYTKMLVVESIEEHKERVYDDTSIAITKKVISWGFSGILTNVVDDELGLSGTIALAKRTDSGIAPPYTIYNNYAARYCYDKNRDINGDGIISDDEIVWYLPAQNQLEALWIAYNGISDKHYFNDPYWSATLTSTNSIWVVSFQDAGQDAGSTYKAPGYNYYSVRCVRELTP